MGFINQLITGGPHLVGITFCSPMSHRPATPELSRTVAVGLVPGAPARGALRTPGPGLRTAARLRCCPGVFVEIRGFPDFPWDSRQGVPWGFLGKIAIFHGICGDLLEETWRFQGILKDFIVTL